MGFTPLHLAIKHGRAKVVNALLETRKVNAQARDELGRSPLIHAIAEGYLNVVEEILKATRMSVVDRADSESALLFARFCFEQDRTKYGRIYEFLQKYANLRHHQRPAKLD